MFVSLEQILSKILVKVVVCNMMANILNSILVESRTIVKQPKVDVFLLY